MGKLSVSPKGVAHHPHVNEPDDKYGEVYKLALRYDPDSQEFKDFIEDLESTFQTQLNSWLEGKGKKFRKAHKVAPFYKTLTDSEGEPTGEVVVRFKSQYQPSFADSTGEELKEPLPEVGHNAVLKAGYSAKLYAMTMDDMKVGKVMLPARKVGLTLYLNAIQIIKLSGTGVNTKSLFGSEEGGYIQDNQAPLKEPEDIPFDDSESVDDDGDWT